MVSESENEENESTKIDSSLICLKLWVHFVCLCEKQWRESSKIIGLQYCENIGAMCLISNVLIKFYGSYLNY